MDESSYIIIKPLLQSYMPNIHLKHKKWKKQKFNSANCRYNNFLAGLQ